MKKIVLASGNRGKLVELRELLGDLGIELAAAGADVVRPSAEAVEQRQEGREAHHERQEVDVQQVGRHEVKPGEDPRAGRWRGSNKTECGIHFINGKPVRTTKDNAL